MSSDLSISQSTVVAIQGTAVSSMVIIYKLWYMIQRRMAILQHFQMLVVFLLQIW